MVASTMRIQLGSANGTKSFRHPLALLTLSKCAERVAIAALEMLAANGMAAMPASVRAMIKGKLLSGNCTLSRIVEFAPGQWFVPVQGSLFQIHGMFSNTVHVVVVSPMSEPLQNRHLIFFILVFPLVNSSLHGAFELNEFLIRFRTIFFEKPNTKSRFW